MPCEIKTVVTLPSRMNDMKSNFETLPDEILIIIFSYIDNVYEKFKAFIGLNQRLNNILIDQRLHLLTNFLHIDRNDKVIEKYYSSVIFQTISQRIASINTTANSEKLRQYLQSLIVFHLKEGSIQLEFQIESIRQEHESARSAQISTGVTEPDDVIKFIFNDLAHKFDLTRYITLIRSLVLHKGARLECDNYRLVGFNLATAINRKSLIRFHASTLKTSSLDYSFIEMFKVLLISNPKLVMNRDSADNTGGRPIRYFLFYSIYRLQYFYSKSCVSSIDMKWYQAIVDLLILVIKCEKLVINYPNWLQECIFDMLDVLPSVKSISDKDPFVETIQYNIMKIILDECTSRPASLSTETLNHTIEYMLTNLIKKNQLAFILFLYRHVECVQNFFNNRNNSQILAEMMTDNRMSKRLFLMLINEEPLPSWITKEDFIYTLLNKKEHKLIEKLVKLCPSFAHLII